MAAATAAVSSAAKNGFRVAIIGGGVAGCASARRLAQLTPSTTKITIYEIGRGPGGRASARKTRSLPHLSINHGAPYADVRSVIGKSLLSSLNESSSSVVPFVGTRGSLDASTGKIVREEPAAKIEYVTGANGEISTISSSLISGFPSIETKYKTMVRSLSHGGGGGQDGAGEWELRDKHRNVVGTADWLVVAGSGLAHPRWTNTFGGEPPLIAAEKENPDQKLRKALDVIAEQQVSPVLAVFFLCSGPDARKWLSMECAVADVEKSAVISRAMIQGATKKDSVLPSIHGDGEDDGGGDGEEWCSVVLHSTEHFALQNAGVYGKSSSAARVGDAATDASREDALVERMAAAWNEIPGVPAIDIAVGSYEYGPVLHRWGNAFPKGEALPEELSVVPSSRVAFCGDYVGSLEEIRIGSFESALVSGTFAGEKIAKEYAAQRQQPLI